MSNFNKVVLVGHLGGEPIVRNLESEIKVADLVLATHETISKNGEKKEITDWHDIVAWRKLAEFSEKYLHKGGRILVEGKLRTNTWEDKESGKKRKATYVLAETIRFMDRKENSEGPSPTLSTDSYMEDVEIESIETGEILENPDFTVLEPHLLAEKEPVKRKNLKF